jgi:hypothetical protein
MEALLSFSRPMSLGFIKSGVGQTDGQTQLVTAGWEICWFHYSLFKVVYRAYTNADVIDVVLRILIVINASIPKTREGKLIFDVLVSHSFNPSLLCWIMCGICTCFMRINVVWHHSTISPRRPWSSFDIWIPLFNLSTHLSMSNSSLMRLSPLRQDSPARTLRSTSTSCLKWPCFLWKHPSASSL